MRSIFSLARDAFIVVLLGFVISALLPGCVPSDKSEESKLVSAEAPPVKRSFNFTPNPSTPRTSVTPEVELKFPHFVDAAAESGVVHIYDNGASSKQLMVESAGGGCGWIDYDLDGRLDLYLTQGGQPDSPSGVNRPPDVMYRQTISGNFAEIANFAGVCDREYGMGIAIGDFDNDGFDDIFVANVGESSFYINQGDGTFRLASYLLAGKKNCWSSSAAWGDIDRDGDLDLYVCNYTIYDPYHPIQCHDKEGMPAICHPRNVEPEPDEFFLNMGDGKFVESSQKFGLFGPGNKALGVVIADLNDDDWPDIYVANDTTANFLFINEKGQHFQESAIILGGAVSAVGEPQASMGVAFGDYDGNGLPDLCLTHFTGEWNTLYQNLGAQGLHDVSATTGMRDLTLPKLGFGTVMSDFNFDGHMDIMFANGHIDPRHAESEGYQMASQLLSYDGHRWRDGSSVAGDFFRQLAVARGVASADYDRDGDLDLVVVRQNSPTALLQNDSKMEQGVRVAVVGRNSNRSGYNTKVSVSFGNRLIKGEFAGGTSYAASHERLLFFGLGKYDGECQIEVHWPSGSIDRVKIPHPDSLVVISEGQGRRLHQLPSE